MKITSVQIPSKASLEDEDDVHEDRKDDEASGNSEGHEESGEDEEYSEEGDHENAENPTDKAKKDQSKGTPDEGQASSHKQNPPQGSN